MCRRCRCHRRCCCRFLFLAVCAWSSSVCVSVCVNHVPALMPATMCVPLRSKLFICAVHHWQNKRRYHASARARERGIFENSFSLSKCNISLCETHSYVHVGMTTATNRKNHEKLCVAAYGNYFLLQPRRSFVAVKCKQFFSNFFFLFLNSPLPFAVDIFPSSFKSDMFVKRQQRTSVQHPYTVFNVPRLTHTILYSCMQIDTTLD